MSKAEELASQSEQIADARLEDEAYEWSVDADVQLRMCAAELRRLAQVELELEDLKASIGEPVAWIVSISDEPDLGEWFSESHPGDGYSSTPLYAIKEVKQ